MISSDIIDQYEPDHCQEARCVTLLSSHPEDTIFAREHIDEMKLYARILWLGVNLQRVTHQLFQSFGNDLNKKSFIILHWTPSEIVDGDIEYDLITMPRCEQFKTEKSQNTMCKYELTPILKYCSVQLKRLISVHSNLSQFSFTRDYEKQIMQMYNKATEVQAQGQLLQSKEKIYNSIASKIAKELIEPSTTVIRSKRQIFIGGLYPKRNESENEHKGKQKFLYLKIFSGSQRFSNAHF